MTETNDNNRSRSWKGPFTVLVAAVAVIAVTLVLVLLGPLGTLDDPPVDAASLARAVASEIAENHEKHLDIEVPGSSYDELSWRLSRLNFPLVDSERLRKRGLQLRGASYSSIQGEIAAALRLENEAGQLFTLYQTRLTDGLAQLDDFETSESGVGIELWREGNLFLGLAENTTP